MATPFCAHCNNLKLPTNHWLRDKSGQLLCPILQKTECRYCFKMGHTVSRCPSKTTAEQHTVEKHKVERAKPAVTQPKVTNRFAALDESDDEEERKSKRIKKAEEVKPEPIKTFPRPYAAALMSKPAPALVAKFEPTNRTYTTQPVEQNNFVNCATFSSINNCGMFSSIAKRACPMPSNWADWSDEEDDM